jgi:hypothetical protein
LSVYGPGAPIAYALTERPHGGAPVHFEPLYEADTVLLRRGLHGAGVECFVMEVNIFEVLELLLSVLDVMVGLLVRLSLFGSHNALA